MLVLGLLLCAPALPGYSSRCSLQSKSFAPSVFQDYQVVWLSGNQLKDGPYAIPSSFALKNVYEALGADKVSRPLSDTFPFGPQTSILINHDKVAVYSCSPNLAPYLFHPLPINLADKNSISLIHGIGPKLANRIIAERDKQGGFHSPDNLLGVKGIGPKKMSELKKHLSFVTSCEVPAR